jgi:hypothetical protein
MASWFSYRTLNGTAAECLPLGADQRERVGIVFGGPVQRARVGELGSFVRGVARRVRQCPALAFGVGVCSRPCGREASHADEDGKRMRLANPVEPEEKFVAQCPTTMAMRDSRTTT